ncbi:hypothetical protein ABXJ76_03675 [Methylobacter sp. G7]|uniref:hypothetical protein n=1 Tax=Methylobacter sp. G7 TaxID=3230117 RepID=UPI003D806E4E
MAFSSVTPETPVSVDSAIGYHDRQKQKNSIVFVAGTAFSSMSVSDDKESA